MCHIRCKPPLKEVLVKKHGPWYEVVLTFSASHNLSQLPMIQVPLRKSCVNERVLERAGVQARNFCHIVIDMPVLVDVFTLYRNGFIIRIPPLVDHRDVKQKIMTALKTAYGFDEVTLFEDNHAY